MSVAEGAPLAQGGVTGEAVPPGWIARVLAHPVVRIAVPLLIVGLTLFVLHKMAAHVGWAEVKADIAAASWSSLALAVCTTALSFLALSFYDILAVNSVAPGRVPARVAGYAGATGVAISNLLGFSWVTGTAVRYRIYASLGLDLTLVAGVIATAWAGFWLGLGLVVGVLLALHPVGISGVLPIGRGAETAVGLALIAGIAGVFAWLARGGRRLAVWGHGFDLPGLGTLSGLTAASVIDLTLMAATLYVLMPADLTQNFAWFFVVYVAAIAIGILSHTPGGLGVFEAALIVGLGATGRSDVLAALILYRLVYTVLPFLVAVSGLALVWGVTQRHAVGRSATWTLRLVRPLVPMAAAGVAMLAGVLLLISGNLPGDGARLALLSDILPLSFIEASHLAGSVAGLLLVVIAAGLYRKLYRAWVIAMGLMVLGIIASLAKGLDWEEAVGMVLATSLLGAFRSAFYRVEGASVFRLSTAWIVSITALMVALFWVGLFAYSHVQYRDALWWQFALHSDASRFLRASFIVALVLLGIALHSVLTRQGPPRGPRPIPDVVRRLALESPYAEAQIALSGDKQFLVSDDGLAYLAYGDTGGSLITKGEPVGDPVAGARLIWALREKADRAGKRCAFYAVSPRYLATYLDLGLSILKIGEVARVPLAGFTLDGPLRKDFRYGAKRMAKEGYVFEIIPKADLGRYFPELRRVSDAWMAMKQGDEKAFALGAFSEAYLSNFDHAVLRHTTSGRIVAFANLFQSGGRNELSVDLMRHDPAGPKVAMDALFGEMMLWGAAQGFAWFSLGAAPFAGIENRQLASLWNRIGGFVYTHGEQFYHFEGLRAFKQKFDPVWTPNYLASPGGLAAPRILFEVNVLISGGIRGLIG